jgi:hypothetical protein
MSPKHLTSETPPPPDHASTRGRRKPTNSDYKRPAGVQGPNVGYWAGCWGQQGGSEALEATVARVVL